jgi:hypothetical protein
MKPLERGTLEPTLEARLDRVANLNARNDRE